MSSPSHKRARSQDPGWTLTSNNEISFNIHASPQAFRRLSLPLTTSNTPRSAAAPRRQSTLHRLTIPSAYHQPTIEESTNEGSDETSYAEIIHDSPTNITLNKEQALVKETQKWFQELDEVEANLRRFSSSKSLQDLAPTSDILTSVWTGFLDDIDEESFDGHSQSVDQSSRELEPLPEEVEPTPEVLDIPPPRPKRDSTLRLSIVQTNSLPLSPPSPIASPASPSSLASPPAKDKIQSKALPRRLSSLPPARPALKYRPTLLNLSNPLPMRDDAPPSAPLPLRPVSAPQDPRPASFSNFESPFHTAQQEQLKSKTYPPQTPRESTYMTSRRSSRSDSGSTIVSPLFTPRQSDEWGSDGILGSAYSSAVSPMTPIFDAIDWTKQSTLPKYYQDCRIYESEALETGDEIVEWGFAM